MNPLVYFLLFLKASLLSTGGMGNLPSLHADLMARKFAVERQFAESLAIGQISPGPNGLWTVCLGYLTYGPLGALLSAIAISLPPLLVLALDGLYRAHKDHPFVSGFVRGLSLAVVGAFGGVLPHLLKDTPFALRPVMIGLCALTAGLMKRIPIPAILVCAAILGLLWR